MNGTVSVVVVCRNRMLVVTGSKHGNSCFYYIYLFKIWFLHLELILVWIRVGVRVRV